MNEISPIDFFKYYQNNLNFKIIDIRSTNEFEEYHIIDAINIPYNLLMEKHHLFDFSEVLTKNELRVFL